MPLADEIRGLRDRVLTDLTRAHDYYTDTKAAWDLVRQTVAAGHTFSIQNLITGTVTTHAELASKARTLRSNSLKRHFSSSLRSSRVSSSISCARGF
jgi:hypothetical protein